MAECAAEGDGHALLRMQNTEFFIAQFLLVSFFHVVSPFLEHGSHECMHDSQQENYRSGQVEIVNLDTVDKLIPEPHTLLCLGVNLQRNRETAVLQFTIGIMVCPGCKDAIRVSVVDRLTAFRAGLVGHGQGKPDLHGSMFQYAVSIVGVVLLCQVALKRLQAHGFCCNE